MKKEQTILYEVHDNLYVNLTNRCPCACTFCLRQNKDHMEESGSLWLSHEPDYEEVIEAFSHFSMERYRELVFCGFGEPTERLSLLLQAAAFAREHFSIPIRVNTNGLGDLICEQKTAPLLKGLIDTVSISLNTPNEAKYHELVRSRFGAVSYQAMLSFAKDCTSYVPNVIMTTVATTLTKEEEQECRKICKNLGVSYRIRPWES